MELTNEFTVGVPVEETWKVLTDVERIAPCLPGAELQEIDGDQYKGLVKVKVGPITAQYKGVATFQEKDDANHKAVLKAEGRDTKGQGNASAVITATLEPVGSSTKVKVVTDLTITGKVAQFGRGVMADVSTKLINQFAESLDQEVQRGGNGSSSSSNGSSAPSASGSQSASSTAPADTPVAAPTGPRRIQSRPAEPVDLLGTAGSPVAKRVGPVVGVVVVLLWLMRRRRKKRK